MYRITINGTQLASSRETLREARLFALDQLDTASVLAHQFKKLIVVTIIDAGGNEHWRIVLGNSYR
jgi:hypothetical protein